MRRALFLAPLFLFGGCVTTDSVVVYCASSMQEAVLEISEQAQINVLVTPGGSDVLAYQISQGAAADVLITADLQAMEIAGKEKQAAAFATAELAVASRGLTTFNELGRPAVRIAAASKDVPAGRYAQAALNKVESKLAEAIRKNIVTEEPSSREALKKLAVGEVDAAFVYNTDISAPFRRINVPAEAHQRATYYIVALSERGKEFVSVARTSTGRTALQRLGFGKP